MFNSRVLVLYVGSLFNSRVLALFVGALFNSRVLVLYVGAFVVRAGKGTRVKMNPHRGVYFSSPLHPQSYQHVVNNNASR